MPPASDVLIKDFAMGLHECVAFGYSFGASAPHNAAPQARRDWEVERLDPGFGVGVKFRNRNDAGSTRPWPMFVNFSVDRGTRGGLSRQRLDFRNTDRGGDGGAVLAVGRDLERRAAW